MGIWNGTIKKTQIETYKIAFSDIENLMIGNYSLLNKNLPEQVSLIKGLFNRVYKQDQWDWFTVFAYLDFPLKKNVCAIVSLLTSLRKSLLKCEINEQETYISLLKQNNFLSFKQNFFDYHSDKIGEYIYILSKRNEKDLLKIGRTSRNVIKRVNEINSSTGIVYPYSARMVYKVKDSIISEKLIHDKLKDYRVREDREFFLIDFHIACDIIDKCLLDNEQI